MPSLTPMPFYSSGITIMVEQTSLSVLDEDGIGDDEDVEEVEVEVVVDSTITGNPEAFKTMREYQNFVFLLNPGKGLYIFNSLGNYLRTIGGPGIRSFNFLGEELYYLQNGKLHFFNLFTTDTRQIDIGMAYTDVLLTDERMILFIHNRIDICSFRP